MGAYITDADLAELRAMYPLNNFPANLSFTTQEEKFILYYMRGLNPEASAVAVGLEPAAGKALLQAEAVQLVISYLREKEFNEVRISRDKLNSMLLDAHSHAQNTMEEVAAIRELGKMNDLYADAKHRGSRVQVNIGSQVNNVKNVKQIEKMDDQQLIELAGEDILLSPEDFQEVKDVRE